MNIHNEIIKELKSKGAKGNITSETQFSKIGLDSLDLMDMITVLEERLSIFVPDDKLLEIKTIKDLENVIAELTK
ncbi:acyl carrier protein [Mesoplasma chauliocola]|uniref:Acyl carrier protein n=1 Tax=Mesoplasma chauliocola TaxID=216427 RepID=A0A249SP12_9MOLU|nr:acyl carrier protein [Mesoplasma chauliocola]ASZ09360.1 acyl carrier protein [Mesoplasma chauliocola]